MLLLLSQTVKENLIIKDLYPLINEQIDGASNYFNTIGIMHWNQNLFQI